MKYHKWNPCRTRPCFWMYLTSTVLAPKSLYTALGPSEPWGSFVGLDDARLPGPSDSIETVFSTVRSTYNLSQRRLCSASTTLTAPLFPTCCQLVCSISLIIANGDVAYLHCCQMMGWPCSVVESNRVHDMPGSNQWLTKRTRSHGSAYFTLWIHTLCWNWHEDAVPQGYLQIVGTRAWDGPQVSGVATSTSAQGFFVLVHPDYIWMKPSPEIFQRSRRFFGVGRPRCLLILRPWSLLSRVRRNSALWIALSMGQVNFKVCSPRLQTTRSWRPQTMLSRAGCRRGVLLPVKMK